MPRMSEAPAAHRLIKLLLIGDGKLGKSFYAGMAAEKLNTLYLDGDVGAATLSQLPAKIQQNIYLMSIGDSMLDGRKDKRMFDTFHGLMNNATFHWQDELQREATSKDSGNIWDIRLGAMDHTSLLVLDSWTSMTESIMTACALGAGVDLNTAKTSEMRPVYQMAGVKAGQLLQAIRSLRCHVIVIAHPDEYSHTSKPDGRKVSDIRESDLTVEWTKMIPKSTSKPQGLQMAKYFSDVAWMETNPAGTQRLLNFRMSESKVSGGHFDDRKDASTAYSFVMLMRQIGIELPDSVGSTDAWLTMRNVETLQPTEGKVLDGTKPTSLKGVGLSGLLGKS